MTDVTITLPEGYTFETKIAGQVVAYDPSKMHTSWVQAFLEKGMQRFANDKYSGEEPSNKLALCQALAADAMSGEALVAYQRQATSRLPNDVALAVKTAKQDLTIIFKKVTGLGKATDFAAHEKIAPFFKAKGDGVEWVTESVTKWIAKQKEAGKRDYMGEAQASLAVDVEDLDL